MTKLEFAFAEAAKLPQAEQDALAEMILRELEAENSWMQIVEASADNLADLADEALREHRSGQI